MCSFAFFFLILCLAVGTLSLPYVRHDDSINEEIVRQFNRFMLGDAAFDLEATNTVVLEGRAPTPAPTPNWSQFMTIAQCVPKPLASGSLFWTGYSVGADKKQYYGLELAKAFAVKSKYETLEMVLKRQGCAAPWIQGNPQSSLFWGTKSKQFAENSRGTINALLGQHRFNNANPSDWVKMEAPTLAQSCKNKLIPCEFKVYDWIPGNPSRGTCKFTPGTKESYSCPFPTFIVTNDANSSLSDEYNYGFPASDDSADTGTKWYIYIAIVTSVLVAIALTVGLALAVRFAWRSRNAVPTPNYENGLLPVNPVFQSSSPSATPRKESPRQE